MINYAISLFSNGTVDQLANLLSSETLGERLDNGMTLLHLCCLTTVGGRKKPETEEEKKQESNECKIAVQTPCFLQLIKLNENNCENVNSESEESVVNEEADENNQKISYREEREENNKNAIDGEICEIRQNAANKENEENCKNAANNKRGDNLENDASIKCDEHGENPANMESEEERCVQYTKMQTSKEVKDKIRLLLQKGADPAIISKNGFSPLHLASYKVITPQYSLGSC